MGKAGRERSRGTKHGLLELYMTGSREDSRESGEVEDVDFFFFFFFECEGMMGGECKVRNKDTCQGDVIHEILLFPSLRESEAEIDCYSQKASALCFLLLLVGRAIDMDRRIVGFGWVSAGTVELCSVLLFPSMVRQSSFDNTVIKFS